MSQNLTTWVKNNWAATSAGQYHGVAIKIPYLENLSTTTIIEPHSSIVGNAIMKSIRSFSTDNLGLEEALGGPRFYSAQYCPF